MRKASGHDVIRIRGARQNNLKGFDLDLPVRSLIVVTGLSGSGKSSLAFDTLYAEGQRRYIETFSPYARQFFDRMDKPRVDAIEGIPPAIALEQRNAVRTTRSTVGTMTEICDHMKLLWPHLAQLYCRQCGKLVTKETPRDIWERISAEETLSPATGDALRTPSPTEAGDGQPSVRPLEALVTFQVALSAKLSLGEQLALVAKQGFQRIRVDGEVLRLDEALPRFKDSSTDPTSLIVVQDRVKLSAGNRVRFIEACEQAYHFGHGRLTIFLPAGENANERTRWTRPIPFSRQLHCASCDLEYAEPAPALFSFNHPLGACPACKGFGRIIAIDYDLAIPDRSKTLAEGAIRPWQTGTGAESQADLVRQARKEGVPLDVPFGELSPVHQRWVIDGDPDYGEDNEWPHAWYGVRGYFRWLESKAYKMHVRVLLSRYRAYTTCPACQGRRLQPDALLWRLAMDRRPSSTRIPSSSTAAPSTLALADFYALPIRDALPLIDALAERHAGTSKDPLTYALGEVQARLRFLDEVGVGYLTLDRPTRTLSGGETQRVNLTTCLGSRLVNALFVLDEPSVGLHARDTERLVRVLTRLRDLGNTVVVVEHEAVLMREADQIVDLGPGHGDSGGDLVVQGTLKEILGHPTSLTGAYLAGRRRIPIPVRRPVQWPSAGEGTHPTRSRFSTESRLAEQAVVYRVHSRPVASQATPALSLRGVTRHNLRDVEITLPLARLVCLSGVSGSGKTTLASELLRLLQARMAGPSSASLEVREAEREQGDADPEAAEPGRFPTTATLEGAEQLGAVLLVDQSPIGRTPRSNPAVYSGAFDPIRELFAQTELARQRGLTASAFSFNSAQGQCEQCRGAGFEKVEMQFLSDVFIRCPACSGRRYRPHILEVGLEIPGAATLSIADMLDQTIDEALTLLAGVEHIQAGRAQARLRVVQDVGLGYLRLGQPINTLSGGESQRLKLAGHLAESAAIPGSSHTADSRSSAATAAKPTLFVFDEPTTGLHFDDVRVLLQVFQRLVDSGHSVLIIEHNLELLKCADWLIDLGPEGGDAGGRIVVVGPPEVVAECPESHTGRALRGVLDVSPA